MRNIEGKRQPNHAIGEAVRMTKQTGEPYVLDQRTANKLIKEPSEPYHEAFQNFSHPLQERILEGVEILTIHPDGRIANHRIDGGH